MKKFAFAALLALPALGFLPQDAAAGGNCCGAKHHLPNSVVRKYFVPDPTIVYDRREHDSDTGMRLKGGTWIYARCYSYGWCKVEPRLYENAFVLRKCLRLSDAEDVAFFDAPPPPPQPRRRPWRRHYPLDE